MEGVCYVREQEHVQEQEHYATCTREDSSLLSATETPDPLKRQFCIRILGKILRMEPLGEIFVLVPSEFGMFLSLVGR